MKANLSIIIWLWAPLLTLGVMVACEVFGSVEFLEPLNAERGPYETLQFLIMAPAFLLALHCLKIIKFSSGWLSLWVGIAVLSCFYVAGEEISWGQHIFDWGTPEYWTNVNDQQETNLHNTSSWLDQKPRLILLIGVVVGGLIIPLMQHLKSPHLPEKFKIIYPPAILAPIAVIALGIKITEKLDERFIEGFIFYRASELEETFLFYFVLLYMITLRRRIIAGKMQD